MDPVVCRGSCQGAVAARALGSRPNESGTVTGPRHHWHRRHPCRPLNFQSPETRLYAAGELLQQRKPRGHCANLRLLDHPRPAGPSLSGRPHSAAARDPKLGRPSKHFHTTHSKCKIRKATRPPMLLTLWYARVELGGWDVYRQPANRSHQQRLGLCDCASG